MASAGYMGIQHPLPVSLTPDDPATPHPTPTNFASGTRPPGRSAPANAHNSGGVWTLGDTGHEEVRATPTTTVKY